MCQYLHRSFQTAAIAAASCFTSFSGHAQDSVHKQIEDLAQPYIDAEIVVGMSIGVLKDGQETMVHLGRVSAEGKQPDADTIYEIGSVSKVFTGILLADAVDRHQVRLDQPAQELLPGDVTMPAWKDEPITLVDLATHASGLPRLADNMPSLNTDNPYADYTAELAHAFLNGHKLRRAPGSKHEYSNLGMALDATLTFKLDDAGKCQALELFQNGVRQTAKRIE